MLSPNATFSATDIWGKRAYDWKTVLTGLSFGRLEPHLGPVDTDAPLGGVLEAGNHSECGRLAAPGRPEQREELAIFDRQVDAVHRHDVVPESFGDASQLDRRVGHQTSSYTTCPPTTVIATRHPGCAHSPLDRGP